MLEETAREWAKQLRKEGRREGQHEGQLKGMREMLLQQMTLRFGRIPAGVRRQVEAISSTQELRRLGRRIPRAESLEEMELG